MMSSVTPQSTANAPQQRRSRIRRIFGRLFDSKHDRQAQVSLRLRSPAGTVESEIPLDIRRARGIDAPDLLSFRERIALNEPRLDWPVVSPFWAGLRQALPFTPQDQPIILARSNGRPVGYAQFHVEGPDQRWVLDAVGANLGIYDTDTIWEELLRYGVISAGLDGTKRLYARTEADSPVARALRQVGYAPYASERVFAATNLPVVRPSGRARMQAQSDVWSVYQLYMATVPRQVQYIEALTSHHWDPLQIQRAAGVSCTGWLIEEGYMAVAYARVVSRDDAHVIEFMVHPEWSGEITSLLDDVFSHLTTRSSRRVYAIVRGYQSELGSVLERAGFMLQKDQDLHVKYTTASSYAKVSHGVPVEMEVPERVGKRVPTFMHERSPDPTSNNGGSSSTPHSV